MRTINTSAPVLVTGGNGYIASWLIKMLLEDGHTVHTTVRDPRNMTKVEHLTKMAANAPGTLKIFKADLLTEGAFDEAMQGCELVMHTASPFIVSGFKDANEALVRPAKEGTRNVLEAANRVFAVKRVVLTSSVAAIYGDAKDMQNIPRGYFSEEDWNTSSSTDHQPYSYSKVIAEKEAWTICRAQDRWDMVVINPSMVYGPSLSKSSGSTSISTMVNMGDGTMKLGVPKLTLGVVDVRDVALAHVKAGFTPEASGRHIVSATEISFLEMGRMLEARYGDAYPFPKRELPKFLVWLMAPKSGVSRGFVHKNVGYPVKFDNSVSREKLGLAYRPIEQTITDHFEQLIEDRVV